MYHPASGTSAGGRWMRARNGDWAVEVRPGSRGGWSLSRILGLVKGRLLLVALAGRAACRSDAREARRGGKPVKHAVDTAVASLLLQPRARSRDRSLTTPRVITEPSVVVFWLSSSDTLSRDSAESASRDLDYYTEQVAPTLTRNDIALIPTTVDTVFVDLPGHTRRAIVLSGLDYPYGYLLVDPGTPERILTGVYDDDALRDELNAYFDLSDEPDTSRVLPRAITD